MTKKQKMHTDEIDIDTNIVCSLLKDQCVQLAHLPLEGVTSYGTDHALFRLGSEYVIRLPRRESAVASLEGKCALLPAIGQHISFSISTPIFFGSRTDYYPYPWVIFQWISGNNPDFETDNNYHKIAIDLANFLNELHQIPSNGIQPSRRGIPLHNQDEETRVAHNSLRSDLENSDEILLLWQNLCNVPDWEKEPVLIHGDLLPGNILIQHDHLIGVIDWSDIGVGDPAVDCIIAWAIFNRNSRNLFQKWLKIDSDTWLRGRGWALSISLVGLAYYKKTNPQFCKILYRMLSNVLQD